MTALERFQGCLLGLAVGDALGTTLEFKAPGSFAPIFDIVGGGPFTLPAGAWTDDTSMALCLAESLIECGGFDAADQMRRYCRWFREGHLSSTSVCFDIGTTVQSALRAFERTGDPWSGSTHPRSAGNGSIMRLAPAPLFFARNRDEALQRAVDSSRTTHGAATCLDACRYLAALILGALEGRTREELLAPAFAPNLETEEIREIAAGSFKEKQPPEIRGTGYVVRSLEAALWAFHRGEDFREGALLAVNLGDDADTTGAVYGQLAGAWYGVAGIPEEWRACIVKMDLILSFAEALWKGSEV